MSNVEIKITADVADLAAKFAVARAESSALTQELNKLARQAATTGMTDELKGQLTQSAEAMLNAKVKAADLQAQLKEAQGVTQSFGSTIADVNNLLGPFGAALSVGTLIGFGKGVLSFAADVQHMSDVLGISSTDLQAFQYAARESGVSTEDADMLLRRFMNSMGAVQEGTGPAKKAIEDLGLTAEELAGDPMEALQKIASALLGMTDATRRAHDEVEIFGRSGLDLNAMLLQLAEGLDTMKQRASDAGEMMDPKVTEAAKHAEDQMSQWFAMMEGKGAAVLVDMIEKGGMLVTVLKQAAELDAGRIAGRGVTADKPPPTPKPPVLPEDITLSIEAQEQIKKQEAEGQKIYDEMQRKKPPHAKSGGTPLGTDPDMMAQVKAEQAELRSMDQSDAETTVRLAQNAFDQKKAILGEEVAAGKISKQQELADLITATQAEEAVKLKALNDEIANNSEDLVLVNKLENDKKIVVAQTETEIAALRRQIEQDSANEQIAMWKRAFSEIGSAEDSFVSKVMGGRTTMWGALVAAGQQFAEKEIESDLKGMTARLLMSQQELAQDKSLGEMGVLWDAIFGDQKVAAAVSTATETTTVKATASAAGIAIDRAAGAATISKDAATAAAGAYSAVAGIPYIGPILAPVAAAVALGAVEAFGSFEVGAWEIPTKMHAMLHPGEMVIPQNFASAIRSGGAAGIGGQHFNVNATFNHNGGGAWNAEDHARDITRVLKNQLRLGVR